MNRIRTALLALVAVGALSGSLAGTSDAAILVPGLPTLQDVQTQMARANFPILTGQDSPLTVHFALCTDTAPCS